MAADILQLFFEFLRVQGYANTIEGGPLYQLLFAFFLPTILLLMIIITLGEKVAPGHKGLTILSSVAIYIFVIAYPPPPVERSLYSIFAPISNLWWLVVVVIGILLILVGKFKEPVLGHGGAPKAKIYPEGAGFLSGLGRRTKRKFTGEENDLKNLIEKKLDHMADLAKAIENPKPGTDTAKLRDIFFKLEEDAEARIKDLEEVEMGMGFRLKIAGKYSDRLKRLSKKLS